MLRSGEILFHLVAATADFLGLWWHPVTRKIGIIESVLRIQRAVPQALPNRPGGGGLIGASARVRIRLLDQSFPAPRPGRNLVQEECVDAVIIDAIEPTEAIRAVAVPV
jgi:hypothetical protein